MGNWVGMFTRYYDGVKTDDVMCTGNSPEEVIAYTRRLMQERETRPFKPSPYENEKHVLFREETYSTGKTGFEYGWAWAFRVPEVSDTLDFTTEVAT